MHVIRWLTLGCLFAAPAVADEAPGAAAGSVFEELRASLREAPLREIHFREERHFPFRFRPVELEGIVRLHAGTALSIEYPAKDNAVLIDDKGILMRSWSGDGERRERTPPSSDAALAELLRALFEFDQPRLEEDFRINAGAAPEAGAWRLNFEAREAEGNRFESIAVEGAGRQVDWIEIDFGSGKRIEIRPVESKIRAGFSGSERARYFRGEED